MLREAQLFVSDILTGQSPRWLFLCGKSGVGKTHLARRIADFISKWGEWAYNKHGRALVDAGHSRYETTWPYAQSAPVFAKWAAIVDSARDGDYEAYRRASADWYKVVDDVGAEGLGQDRRPTSFVVNQLGKLCDARLGRWTVFTSNFHIADFAEVFDARISSRILREGNVHVDLTLRDFNLRIQPQ